MCSLMMAETVKVYNNLYFFIISISYSVDISSHTSTEYNHLLKYATLPVLPIGGRWLPLHEDQQTCVYHQGTNYVS